MTLKLEEINLTGLNLTQLKQLSTDYYKAADAIHRKYPTGPIETEHHEDWAEEKRLLSELDVIEDRLAPLEEADARGQRIQKNLEILTRPATDHKYTQVNDQQEQIFDAGWQFINSKIYQQTAESGVLNSNRNRVEFAVPLQKGSPMLAAQRKALVFSGTGSAGSLVRNDQRPGFLELLQRGIVITDLMPSTPTESDTIEYVRETTFTNSAAFTAEATATTGTSGTKPESVLAYDTQTASVKTLAHWIPVTNRMLADAPALRGVINQRLLLGLDLALESQIIDGDGTGENLTGILRTTGILIQGVGSDNVMDAIYKARTQVMVTGLARPNGIVMHPNDWQGIRLSRENAATGTLGGYLYGPPSVAGPMTVFGMPVVEALGAVENTVLVGDFAMGAMIFDREQAQIRTGLINDQFVRNMQTILAELRMALVVFRPTAFAKVTGA